ncbi:hypothetical protein OLEAN_C26450 [Oleispira antarctica RB-8]|uniref:Potassium channel domain-containing protein n=1 Tax=Oleispira antarctica RB-8 TaxID=698738 RepID=R4YNY5_OLEAN|nr:hypothetical protein OLEAN_C26450 [Oleispira antarctica RB-8]
MIRGLDYSNFIQYLKTQLEESSREEVNGVEVFFDYYLDYPPDGLDEGDSDFFREEIDRLVQAQIFYLNNMLSENESTWLTIDDDKWKLNPSAVEKKSDDQSELFKRLAVEEKALFELSMLEVDESLRKKLVGFYNQKVKKYGGDKEKLLIIKLIVDSYQYAVSDNCNYVDYMSAAGEIGGQLEEKGCYKYYEQAGKYYRNKYEHEESAKQFGLAIDAAKTCKEDNDVILCLTKNMRIQYELCGDEDGAATAFVHENDLKALVDGRIRIKIVLSILRVLSDYCQNPKKVAFWAFILILLSALLYGFSGITPSGSCAQTFFTSGKNLFRVFFDSIYFSIVTFTTLGYGDFSPSNDFSRFVANIEALGGLFFTSLFLVSIVRKYGR